MNRPSKRTTALLAAGAIALGVGGATIGVAASGSDPTPAKALADALNKNEGTKLTEADVREAMESVFKGRLDAAVSAGRLTQAQADEMVKRFKEAPARRAAHEAAQAARIAPVEKVLGMTAADIRAKLVDGTTLAKLAESKGVSRDKLLDAIKEGIRDASASEGVTFSDQRLDEMAAAMADGTGFGGRRGPGGFGGRGHHGGGFGGGSGFLPFGP